MKSGILLVNKPKDFTSFDVVAVLRGMLKEKKIGHGGTLDPNVTGVLPIFIGKATKAIDLAPTHDKKYSCTFRLGIKTDTQDIWGEVIEENEPVKDIKRIEDAVLGFKGEIMQTPPMFSAIKINGKRLYDLAREGQVVERPQRKITVYDIAFEGVVEEENEYKFSAHVSKGAYIRTICDDIGEKLGCGAAMTSLHRTSALGFDIKDCFTLDQIQKAVDEASVESLIIGVDTAFNEYPSITLSEKQTKMYKNGVGLEPQRVKGVIFDSVYNICEGQMYRVYGADSVFIGIGAVNYEKREFRSVKMFCGEEK